MVREREEEQAWRQERIGELAGEVMKLARDSIVVNMRFLDTALSRLEAEARNGLGGAAADGGKLYYDPAWLLKKYREETGYPVRLYLHVLFHFVFSNIYLLYFIAICALLVFKILPYKMMFFNKTFSQTNKNRTEQIYYMGI